AEIEPELRKVQHLALENNLRWMDVQLALANNDENVDNTIIDGLKTVEKTVEGYTESNVHSALIGTSAKQHAFENISGKEIGENEALRISRNLLNLKDEKQITLTETGDGADMPLYSASYHQKGKEGYVDILKQGGHPISRSEERRVGKECRSRWVACHVER